MNLGENVEVKVEKGDLVARVKLGTLLKAKLSDLKAKVQSGEIDIIKNTTLDNDAMVKAIELIEAELDK